MKCTLIVDELWEKLFCFYCVKFGNSLLFESSLNEWNVMICFAVYLLHSVSWLCTVSHNYERHHFCQQLSITLLTFFFISRLNFCEYICHTKFASVLSLPCNNWRRVFLHLISLDHCYWTVPLLMSNFYHKQYKNLGCCCHSRSYSYDVR